MQTVSMMHFYSKKYHKTTCLNIHNSDEEVWIKGFDNVYSDKTSMKPRKLDIIVNNFVSRDESNPFMRKRIVENLDLDVAGEWAVLGELVPHHPKEFLNYTRTLTRMTNIYFAKCISEPINIHCASQSFQRMFRTIKHNPMGKKVMNGKDFKPAYDQTIGRVGTEQSAFIQEDTRRREQGPPTGYPLLD